MARKEVRGDSLGNSYRSRWGFVALALMVAAAAMVVRHWSPPQQADAQLPRGQRPTAPRRSAAQPAQPTPTPTVGNVLAVVNGEPIYRHAIGQQCLVRWGKETLESLVNKQLITEACQARGIVISEADVNAEVDSIARKFGMSTDQYLDMLNKERDVSATEYKRDIVWPTIALKRLAADRLTVSQEQLDREYESEYGPKVQVRMISLTTPTEAIEVLKLARANPNEFARLAKQYSKDPNSASAKGLIPPVRKHMGEPEVEKAVFALEQGQVSDVVKAADQYFIFYCERHIPAATISPQFRRQTEQRLRDRIIERNLRKASGEIFKELQDRAKIVNVMNDPKLRKQSPDIAAFVNGRQISQKQLVDECILRYGRGMVETEINHRLLAQALKQRNLTVAQEALNAEIERAAEAFGYITQDGKPNVEAWIAAVTEQEGIGVKEYVSDAVWPTVALKQLVGDDVAVTEDDLTKGFEANYGERVEVLAIVLSNHRTAQDVWDLARKNNTNEFFGQLAEQYSVEPISRANYGEIPPIRRHGGQPQIESEAFRLQPGELSGIVAMGEKYIILKCLGRTKPIVEKLDDVRTVLGEDIREKKLRLAMTDEFDRLRNSAQIDNFLEGTSQSGKTTSRARNSKVPVRPVGLPGGKRLIEKSAP